MAYNPWPVIAVGVLVWAAAALITGDEIFESFSASSPPDDALGWVSYAFSLFTNLFMVVFSIATLNLDAAPGFIRAIWSVLIGGSIIWAVIEGLGSTLARLLDALIPG